MSIFTNKKKLPKIAQAFHSYNYIRAAYTTLSDALWHLNTTDPYPPRSFWEQAFPHFLFNNVSPRFHGAFFFLPPGRYRSKFFRQPFFYHSGHKTILDYLFGHNVAYTLDNIWLKKYPSKLPNLSPNPKNLHTQILKPPTVFKTKNFTR